MINLIILEVLEYVAITLFAVDVGEIFALSNLTSKDLFLGVLVEDVYIRWFGCGWKSGSQRYRLCITSALFCFEFFAGFVFSSMTTLECPSFGIRGLGIVGGRCHTSWASWVDRESSWWNWQR